MKMITAYVRDNMATHVVAALAAAGATEFTVLEVRRIVGGLPPGAYEFSVELGERFESMTRLEIVCRDENADTLSDAIRGAASTGRHGDGVIFISGIDSAVRVSDGRRGADVFPV